jgi:hypothetical protein
MANQPHDRLTPGSISAAVGRRKRLGLWLGSAALLMPGAALAIPPGGYSGLQASPTPTPTATPTPKPKPRTPPPTSILPASMQPVTRATPTPQASPAKPVTPKATPSTAPYIDAQPTTAPVTPPPVITPGAPGSHTVTTTTIVPAEQPVRVWTLADAQALLAVVKTIDTEGLFPGDYKPEVLAAAITAGAAPRWTKPPAAPSTGWPKTCATAAPRWTAASSGSPSTPMSMPTPPMSCSKPRWPRMMWRACWPGSTRPMPIMPR